MSEYKVGDWPHPKLIEMWKADDHSWLEVTEQIYWDQLEVVPPLFLRGRAFMVGEPWNHIKGIPVHVVFVELDAKHFARLDYTLNFDPHTYKMEIRKQIYEPVYKTLEVREKQNGFYFHAIGREGATAILSPTFEHKEEATKVMAYCKEHFIPPVYGWFVGVAQDMGIALVGRN